LRRMRMAALLGAALLLAAMPVTVFAGNHTSGGALSDIPVTGTLEDGGTFEGTVNLNQLQFEDGQLTVSGVLNGVATTVDDVAHEITNQAFTTTLDLSSDTGREECRILFLDLGPIFLDLLGLEVDLSQIELEVRAVPGPGNLLGNLLCSVVHLLDRDPGSAVQRIVDQINRLL
jgi:hypothetical protein